MKLETMGWQWHQLDHMQIICTSLHIDNHASTSSLDLFRGRMLLSAFDTVGWAKGQASSKSVLCYVNC